MYLKRLTMKGFKSFADPTTLEFEPGVTVVVGPNGSGKSNVVDAVTWVLGAQGPRSMRSAKMEDVIFAGTSSRPALGRSEVSLTIDNADGKLPVDMAEVTISRTLFRSGDSEYAINGAPCRLLDIQELLSDSGVGRQQHMIIGQGQLANVLDARPEERRSIIEEAAGVLKHRRRKERAERRLASTQENLERLGDLVREVRRQMRPLERQAAAARQYGTLAQERYALRLHLAGQDYAKYQARRDEIATLLRTSGTTEQELRQTLAELDAQATATAANLTHDQAEDLAKSVADVQGLTERARGLDAVLEQRAQRVKQSLEAAADEDVVASLETDSAKVRAEIMAVDEAVEALSPERSSLRDAEGALERAESEYEATWGGGEDEDALEALKRASERAELLERAASVREEQLTKVTERIGRIDETMAASQAQRGDAERALVEATQRATSLSETVDAARAIEVETDNALQAAEETAAKAEEKSARASARAEALGRALDELSGRSSQAALKELKGVVGSLVELMVVEPGWERAVEAAAGAAVAAVVVDSRSSAREALEQLRREGANGLVLAAGGRSQSIADLPAGAESVRSHVSLAAGATSELSGVLDQLFGRAVRVGNVEAAIDLALERPELVVVTETGDRFSASGWRITAGTGVVTAQAVAEATALAAKASEEAELAQRARVDARQAHDAAVESLAQIRRELDHLSADALVIEARVATAAAAIERSTAERGEAAQSQSELADALETERASLREVAERLPELEQAASVAEERARWAAEAAATLEAHRNQVRSMRQELEVRTAELVERRRTLAQRLEEVERRLAGHVEARNQAEARRLRLEANLTAIVRLAQITKRCGEELENLLRTRRTAYEAEVQSMRASNERLEQLRRDRAGAETALNAHQGRSRELEIESAEVAIRLEATLELIRKDLEVDPLAAIEAPLPELPEGMSAEERALSLEAQLDALGPINPLALEELSALEERSGDLETQVNDVREARRELQEVVRTLDEEIMNTFASAAADVNEHFSALVALLFPGGQGRMVLTDPDDLLNTGVEIEVRPLGKNVRRVSLLSGGERSMAALAFLFSVFRSRPSPFYLMDEVEVALDDVNLHRFLGLLQEFRDEAQLIVVSHQKRTMETGDALYGVTMAPGGSSQAVSQKVPKAEASA
jgi:chromosome segregation protein